MEINFDDNFDQITHDVMGADNKITDAAKTRLREAAFTAKRKIVIRMPVDRGAAQASWGAEDEAGIWEFSQDGLEHTQGSELPYVNRLNDGYSNQAPAGFIDAEHEKAITLFVDKLLVDMGKILG
jgi:hypothetical protein